MIEHKGMRPQDIVILLKVATFANRHGWTFRDIAQDLGIRDSEVTDSLRRSLVAGLVSEDRRQLMRPAFYEFIEHGLKYVFPQVPGKIVLGVSTGRNAWPLQRRFASKEKYVWPWLKGKDKGYAIRPLHAKVPGAALKDIELHALLALTDDLRLWDAKLQKGILAEFKRRIEHPRKSDLNGVNPNRDVKKMLAYLRGQSDAVEPKLTKEQKLDKYPKNHVSGKSK